MADMGMKSPHKKDGPLLQFLGTEWGRKTYGDAVWVNALRGRVEIEKLKRNNDAARLITIISDCRFENEFDAFPEALRIRLVCSEAERKLRAEMWRENTQHPSETGLDLYAAHGKFDLMFNTEDPACTPEHMATLILAQLDKDCWIDKRGLELEIGPSPCLGFQN